MPDQLSLLTSASSPADKLEAALTRLAIFLGEDRVGSPGVADSRSDDVDVVPYSPPALPRLRRNRDHIGLVVLRALRPPLPLEVVTVSGLDEGNEDPKVRPDFIKSTPPAAAKRPRIQGQVRVASGPWNLEEAWWSATPLRRDYWDVELAGGGLYRIFHDRCSGSWFAAGIYD